MLALNVATRPWKTVKLLPTWDVLHWTCIPNYFVKCATYQLQVSLLCHLRIRQPPSNETCIQSASAPANEPPVNTTPFVGPIVGSVAGACALIIAALMWYRRRKQRRLPKLASNLEKPQLHSDCIPRPEPSELDNTAISELPTADPELLGTELFHELPDQTYNRDEEEEPSNVDESQSGGNGGDRLDTPKASGTSKGRGNEGP